jgi:hypothetical protein
MKRDDGNATHPQHVLKREQAADRMEVCVMPDGTLDPINVYAFHGGERSGELIICHHCKEVIYNFPFIEIGPSTKLNFHATKNSCSAAAIQFQIEHDSVVFFVAEGDDE